MAATLPLVLLAGTAALQGYSMYQQDKSAKQQEFEIKQQQRAAGNAAAQQEIERRQNLLRALASQNAAAGTMGIPTSGSFGNLMRQDVRQAMDDNLAARSNATVEQVALRSRAANARTAGRAAVAGSAADLFRTVLV